MALRAVIDKLEDVDEGLRSHYVAGDQGKFYLTVEGVEAMPAMAALNRKNRELLAEKKTVQDKLAAYGDDTPDTIAELKRSGGPTVQAMRTETDAKIRAIQEKAKGEIEAAKDAAASAQKAAEAYYVDAEIARVLNQPSTRGSVDLLGPAFRERTKVRMQDGRYQLIVPDSSGQPRFKDSQGTLMGIDDVAAELKADTRFSRAFQPAQGSGSGAQPNGGAPQITQGIVTIGDGIIKGVDPAKILSGDVRIAVPQ